jgi:hypothetical protein
MRTVGAQATEYMRCNVRLRIIINFMIAHCRPQPNKRPAVPLALTLLIDHRLAQFTGIKRRWLSLYLLPRIRLLEAVPHPSPSMYMQSPPSARLRLFLYDPALP